MKITFTGGSDDLVSIEGFGKRYKEIDVDEFSVYSGEFSCELHAEDGSAATLVRLLLAGDATWQVALGRIEEGVPLLPAEIKLDDGDRDYNVLLTVLCGDGVEMKYLRDGTKTLAE